VADNEPQVQNTEVAGAKKGKMKLLLIPIVLVLLVVVAAGMAKMGVLPIPGLASQKGGTEKQGGAKATESQVSMGAVYTMRPFIVNLADEAGGRYLKVKFEMELNSKDLISEVEKRMPQLTDSVIMLLSSKRYKDIASYEGKDRLRNEILLRLNSFLTTGFIKKIYFTEFVMQ
jgi:flagellar FliL protein